MKNILFSTTRQWNPGDEFILHGIRRLFSKLNIEYNPVIYNRHPSITPRKKFLKHRWSKPEFYPHYDNSFIMDQENVIDYVVFAGTPEWYGGRRMDTVHQFIADNNIRCAFIGVGVPKKPVFSDTLKYIFSNLCDVIIARDPNCFDAVKEFPNAHFLPCPALFSAPYNKHRENLNNLGIVIQDTSTQNHNIPSELASTLNREFEELEKFYNVTYVAHYIDDLKFAVAQNKKVLYSAFSEDYPAIFDNFDFVISTRVHGCGIASSLGIPNLLIPHDGRFSTAEKFLSTIYDPGKNLGVQILQTDISQKSSILIEHKKNSEQQYLELLRRTLTICN